MIPKFWSQEVALFFQTIASKETKVEKFSMKLLADIHLGNYLHHK